MESFPGSHRLSVKLRDTSPRQTKAWLEEESSIFWRFLRKHKTKCLLCAQCSKKSLLQWTNEWSDQKWKEHGECMQCAEIHFIYIYVRHSVQFLICPICRLSASGDGWCCPWIWYCFNRQTQRSVTLNCLSDTFNLLYEIFRMAECENRVFIRVRPAPLSHSGSILVFCTIYAQKVFSI